MEITKVLDQVDLVSIDVFCPEGWRSLNIGDIKLADGTSLPPPQVMKLGVKRIYDPKDIAVFRNIRNLMHSACLKVGTKFLGGYLVPRVKSADLATVLDELTSKYGDAAKDFLANRDTKIEAWIKQFPDFADKLRAAVEPTSKLEHRLEATVSFIRIAPSDESGDLEKKVERVGNQIFREIATEAEARLDTAFNGRTKDGKPRCTRRTVEVLAAMRDKLDGLTFIDSNIAPLVAQIDTLLAGLPKDGPYEGQDYYNLFSLMVILSDERKALQLAQGLIPIGGAIPAADTESGEDGMQEATESIEPDTADPSPGKSFYFPDDDSDDDTASVGNHAHA